MGGLNPPPFSNGLPVEFMPIIIIIGVEVTTGCGALGALPVPPKTIGLRSCGGSGSSFFARLLPLMFTFSDSRSRADLAVGGRGGRPPALFSNRLCNGCGEFDGIETEMKIPESDCEILRWAARVSAAVPLDPASPVVTPRVTHYPPAAHAGWPERRRLPRCCPKAPPPCSHSSWGSTSCWTCCRRP